MRYEIFTFGVQINIGGLDGFIPGLIVNRSHIEAVDQFVYLVSLTALNRLTTEEVSVYISEVRVIYGSINHLW